MKSILGAAWRGVCTAVVLAVLMLPSALAHDAFAQDEPEPPPAEWIPPDMIGMEDALSADTRLIYEIPGWGGCTATRVLRINTRTWLSKRRCPKRLGGRHDGRWATPSLRSGGKAGRPRAGAKLRHKIKLPLTPD